ncbi:MAG: ATP synthase gamma chain [Candidatus Dojkabacteria bacterium]|nr:MAG: ATP synthase gamma chain [Candidatus Dojkabacteria bacterium]
MALNTKAIKARINSVKNTKKITNAMQMIAAVKMRKAVESAVKTREYANLAMEILERSHSKFNHPLTQTRSVKNHTLILITSNRGLCGSYNSNVLRKTLTFLENHKHENIEIIALGRKAAKLAKSKNIHLHSLYEKLHENPSITEVYPITNDLRERFLKREIDKVTVIFTNYISGLNQKVVARQLLPINKNSLKNILEINENYELLKSNEDNSVDEFTDYDLDDYIYEPNREAIAETIIPMLLDTMLYQAILESAASEHSSRMIAMKNATESAGEMIESLTLEYNKQRQASITQEISEIVGGANAL